VKVVIHIEREPYDRLLALVGSQSREHTLLRNGAIIHNESGGVDSKMIEFICDPEQATSLLGAARKLCPEAAHQIESCIERSSSN
jgi:hypothetical protein